MAYIHLLRMFAILLCASILTGCVSDNSEHPIPKPEGWPRIDTPEANYSVHDCSGIKLLFNSEAKVEIEDKNNGCWINVSYPTFHNAHIYLSLTAIEKKRLSDILKNRRERMELNTSGAATVLSELVSGNGEWNCELASTRSSLTTPIQILAYNPNYVLSGALYLNLQHDATPDSVAPIVNTIERDMFVTLKNLQSK